jgi:hypothetical protein
VLQFDAVCYIYVRNLAAVVKRASKSPIYGVRTAGSLCLVIYSQCLLLGCPGR